MRTRPNRVWAHLTNDEYAHFKKCVTRSGYSADGYIRSLIMGSVPREPPPIEYRQMINELRAIGNAMNQIAARANATGFFLVEEYGQTLYGWQTQSHPFEKPYVCPIG